MPKKSPNRIGIAIVIVVVAVIAALVWVKRGTRRTAEDNAANPVAQTPPANAPAPGTVTLSGAIKVNAPARDPQLGISADAPLLLRYVEMLQWTEKCAGEKCSYAQVWSPQAISSRNFRDKEGHDNPLRLPFATARFVSPDVRLGEVRIDALAYGAHRYAEQPFARPAALAVDVKQLPPNLAINFRSVDGKLYAGGDAAKPSPGDLRITYRTFPAADDVHLTGTRSADRLIPSASNTAPKVQLPPQKP